MDLIQIYNSLNEIKKKSHYENKLKKQPIKTKKKINLKFNKESKTFNEKNNILGGETDNIKIICFD